MKKLSTIRELIQYLWRERIWWLIPFVVVLLVFSLLLLLAGGSGLAPFIYPLF